LYTLSEEERGGHTSRVGYFGKGGRGVEIDRIEKKEPLKLMRVFLKKAHVRVVRGFWEAERKEHGVVDTYFWKGEKAQHEKLDLSFWKKSGGRCGMRKKSSEDSDVFYIAGEQH
jgi:hypothetical protein